jgi:hypothetical protein
VKGNRVKNWQGAMVRECDESALLCIENEAPDLVFSVL